MTPLIARVLNGRPTWQWITGILTSAVLLGTAGWGGYMMNQDERFSRTLERHAGRMGTIESRLAGIEATQLQIQTQLNLIHIDIRRALDHSR